MLSGTVKGKRCFSIVLAIMLCLSMFAGCSSDSEEQDSSSGESGGKAVSFAVTTERSEDGAAGLGVLTAFDENNETVWTFKTDEFHFTELLSEANDIGVHNDMYYVAADAVYAVDLETGDLVWKNEEYPGVVSGYDFDDDGNMYACGYYGPSLAMITPDGDMEYCYDTLNIYGYDSKDFFHAYELEYVNDNKVIIKFESNNTTVEADPTTGEANVQSGSSDSQSYTDEEICTIALDTYNKLNGERPPLAAVDSSDGNVVTVHLYEDMGDHIATWAWYEINLDNMTGKDTVTGKTFDLVY